MNENKNLWGNFPQFNEFDKEMSMHINMRRRRMNDTRYLIS